MANLVIKDLFKSYDKNDPPVVRKVSLEVKPGELVSFLGPSGCGKTTILRMIAGLLLPDHGSISIKGKDVTHLPAYQRDISMVFQNYALFPHLTVEENVAFGLKMRKKNMKRTEIKENVKEALEMVELGEYGKRYPKNLSGGQQQRVALARALVLRPAVLLLDEPLSALDAKLRHETREEIRRLQQKLGLATVFVTHDQEEALAVSDKIVVLNSGIIQQFDSPQTLFEAPQNEFVAKFMGVSNVFNATSIGNKVYRTADGLEIYGDTPNELISAVGVRPERVKIRPGHLTLDTPNRFFGTIAKRSYTGTMVKLVITLENEQSLIALIPSTQSGAQLMPGDEVTAHWDSNDTLPLLPEKM